MDKRITDWEGHIDLSRNSCLHGCVLGATRSTLVRVDNTIFALIIQVMPLINLEYDNQKVSEAEAQSLSKAIRDIVSEATKIEDVFVYANASQIRVKIAPIEIFVRMTAKKIKNEDALMNEIKSKVSEWKKSAGFKCPINLTLIPMNWKVEIGI